MEGPLLLAEGVSFAYGARPVLHGVSLQARSGEVLGIVGPNGSGKSTLLRTLCGTLRPRAGRVLIGGEDVARLSRVAVARRVAVVPQNPHLPEAFTVWEIALLGRTPHLRLLQAEGPRDFAAVRRALEACGVWHLADRRVGELSGGETQRVVIARALAQEPRLLLLDEPTSHLDIRHQTTILDLVSTLASTRGLAVVAVFHDLNLAAQYCHRLAIVRDGSLLAEGTPRAVMTAANVGRAYGTEVVVVSHPHNGLPVALIPGRHFADKGANE